MIVYRNRVTAVISIIISIKKIPRLIFNLYPETLHNNRWTVSAVTK